MLAGVVSGRGGEIDEETHLGLDVIKGRWADDGEADEEDVGLGVGERPQSIVIFLARSIPESEADRLAINHHARGVVVEPAVWPSLVRRPSDVALRNRARGGESRGDEHSGDVFAREGVRGVRDEETCLQSRQGLAPGRIRLAEKPGQARVRFTLPTAPSPVTTHCKEVSIQHCDSPGAGATRCASWPPPE